MNTEKIQNLTLQNNCKFYSDAPEVNYCVLTLTAVKSVIFQP